MSGARPDGSHDKAFRLRCLRQLVCDGKRVVDVARAEGIGSSTLHGWKRNVAEVAEAEALGPTDAAADAVLAAGDGGDVYAGLPPIGAESPDDPSPAMMLILCHHWRVRRIKEALDRLAGWPTGTVQGWFDRAGTDRAAAVRVAQLERAEEVFAGQALDALEKSGNPVAITKLLISLGAMAPDAAPLERRNEAEGSPLAAIQGELATRRAKARGL